MIGGQAMQVDAEAGRLPGFVPLHQQTAYKHFPVAGNGLPISERVAQEVVALPMHPYLDEATQDYIIKAVRAAARVMRDQ